MAVRKPKPQPLEIKVEYTGKVTLAGVGTRPTAQEMYWFLDTAIDAGAEDSAVIQGSLSPSWGESSPSTYLYINVPAQGV